MPDQFRQEIEEVLGGDDHLGVIGAERTRHPSRLIQLGGSVLGEIAHREALYLRSAAFLAQIDHVGGDGARVEPAGEEHPERNVAHEADPGRVAEPPPEVLRQIAIVAALVRRGWIDRLPVAPDGEPAAVEDGVRGRRELVDLGEGGEPGGDVAEAQVEIERLFVELAGNCRIAEERLDLAPEGQPVLAEVVVERLLPQPVAGEEDAAVLPVPDGEGEHPAQALGKLFAPLLVTVDQDLGVAVALEDVALGDELALEIEEVVDLAVEDDPDRSVLVGHRLRAGRREIDDRQAPVAEAERAFQVDAAAVGTAMRDHLGHAGEELAVGWLRRISIQEAADAAHAGVSAKVPVLWCVFAGGSGTAGSAVEAPGAPE